jgi:uracil-DNA glycosylase family 4
MIRALVKIHCEQVRCPLHEGCGEMPTELARLDENERIDLLFVLEAPSQEDVKLGRPCLDESGAFLRRVIGATFPKNVSWAITSMVRTCPTDPNGRARRATSDELAHCRYFLDRDIKRLDPSVLVALGHVPITSFLGGRRNVQDERGRWHRREIAGRERIVLATWHPDYARGNKSWLPVFFDDIQMAGRLAGGWRPPAGYDKIGDARLLRTVADVREFCRQMKRLGPDDYVAVDVETANLNKMYRNQLALLQFAWGPDEAVCIPLDHPATPFAADELVVVRRMLRRLFTEPVPFRAWIAHFGKFEQTLIGRHILNDGIVQRTIDNVPVLDTGAFAYLLNENMTNVKTTRGVAGPYSLKSLAVRLLDFRHYDDTTLSARSSGSLIDLPLESDDPIGTTGWRPNLTDYGGMDAYVTWRLFAVLCDEARAQSYLPQAIALLERFFHPVYRLLSTIERHGFWANLQHLYMLRDPERSPIVSRIREIDRQLVPAMETAQRANSRVLSRQGGGSVALFGETWVLDLQKDAHVREWLVDVCGLEPLSTGKSGVASVGKAFFQEYREVPEVALVEERRGLAKLASAYIKQLLEFLDPRHDHADTSDGRIRCDINVTRSVTGRATASNPNMQQQVRSDSPAKQAIKSIFQAEQPGVQRSFSVDFRKGPPAVVAPTRPTNCLVQLDFMANEVRWWCIMSGCPDLAKALNEGKRARDAYRRDPTPELRDAAKLGGDLHKQTASLMFGVPVKQIDKVMRTATKSIVFGAMYGRGVQALAAQIKKTKEEAQALLDKFSSAFPVGWAWLQRQPTVASEQWQVESPLGRRRRLLGYLVESRNMSFDDRKLISESDRMAKNSVIQGIASDASFIGCALFNHYIERHRRAWKVQNVVHDSCVYEVPIAELRESVEVAERCFTTATMRYIAKHWGVEFPCPIEVEFEMGLRYGEMDGWDFSEPAFEAIMTKLMNATV